MSLIESDIAAVLEFIKPRDEKPFVYQGYRDSDYDQGVDIGLYELRSYALAHKRLMKLLSEKNEFLESLYDEVSPTIVGIDYDLCKMFKLKSDTEALALKILEEKILYETKIAKEKRKSAMFNAATIHLSDKELDAILVRYQGERDETDISASEFGEILTAAERKLVKLLMADRKNQFDRIRKQRVIKEFSLDENKIEVNVDGSTG